MGEARGERPLAELTTTEVARVLDGDPRMILGVATLDPLGESLPLGGGIRIVDEVVRRVSASTGILYAPTFPFGGVTPEGRELEGAAGLQRKTLHRAINDLLAAWEDHGVEEFVVVTAQRSEPHMDALLMAFTSEARTTVFDLLSLDISDLDADGGPLAAGAPEARILEDLDPWARYTGDGPETPAGGAGSGGEAIVGRWVDLIVASLAPPDPDSET